MSGLGTTTTQAQAVIRLRSYWEPQGPTQQALLNYASADGLIASAAATNTITVSASSTNQATNLATMFAAFTAPIFVFVAESTNPGVGFKIGTVTGSPGKMGVGANGFWSYIADGATALPTIYVDNASASPIVLTIGVMTQ